jgi:hypothetical protein
MRKDVGFYLLTPEMIILLSEFFGDAEREIEIGFEIRFIVENRG